MKCDTRTPAVGGASETSASAVTALVVASASTVTARRARESCACGFARGGGALSLLASASFVLAFVRGPHSSPHQIGVGGCLELLERLLGEALARAGRDGDTDLQAGVAANLHVLFPGVVAGKTRFAVAGVARRRGSALRSPADGEPFQQLAIEADVELLRPSHALDVVLILPLEPDFDQVLAVGRKVVANRETAARSERQILALPIVLHHVQRDLEGLERGRLGRQTRRQPRDLTRRAVEREYFGGGVIGPLLAKVRVVHIAHRGREPDSPLLVEHAIMVVGAGVPDLLVAPVG